MKVYYKINFTFRNFVSRAGSLAASFVIILSLLFSQSIFSQEKLVINTGFSSPISTTAQTGFGDQVLGEALKRLGYKLETVQMPAERALINANLGLDDGDLLRIDGLEKKYPNLIKVPEKIMDMDVMLFTKNLPSFKVNGWGSVTTHSVAIITGWKIFEKNLGKESEIIKTDNVNQMYTMLVKNRADFVGYERWAGLGHIKDHNLTDVILLEPPLTSAALYTYLHKKHEKLVPKLAATIKAMKADGTIRKLFAKILKPLLK
jgi:polar amino acid transport system substrate-binding protein